MTRLSDYWSSVERNWTSKTLSIKLRPWAGRSTAAKAKSKNTFAPMGRKRQRSLSSSSLQAARQDAKASRAHEPYQTGAGCGHGAANARLAVQSSDGLSQILARLFVFTVGERDCGQRIR